MSDTIFSKIIKKEIPADFLYEDELCIAIKDKFPKSPIHLLIIPKKPIPTMMDIEQEDQALIGHLFLVAKKLAAEMSLTGYKLIFNVGKSGGQEIMHVHLHLLA